MRYSQRLFRTMLLKYAKYQQVVDFTDRVPRLFSSPLDRYLRVWIWTLIGTWHEIHLCVTAFNIRVHARTHARTRARARACAHTYTYFVICKHGTVYLSCRFLIIPCNSRANNWNRRCFTMHDACLITLLSVIQAHGQSIILIRSYMDCRASAKLVYLLCDVLAYDMIYTSWLAFT